MRGKPRYFGVVGGSGFDNPFRNKTITADVSIFNATKGYVMIHFDKEKHQVVEFFSTAQECLDKADKVMKGII